MFCQCTDVLPLSWCHIKKQRSSKYHLLQSSAVSLFWLTWSFPGRQFTSTYKNKTIQSVPSWNRVHSTVCKVIFLAKKKMTEGFHHWTLSVDLRFKQFGEMFWLRFLWSYTVRMSQGIPIYEFPWQWSTWVCVLAGARLIMAELFHVLMKAFSVRLLEAHGESFKETNGSKKY